MTNLVDIDLYRSTTINFVFLSCHIHVSDGDSTLYSCLNVKEPLARRRRHIWSLSDYNGTRTHSHLVCKQTLNHLAKLASLAKWLSVCLRTKWLWVRIPLLSLNLLFILKEHNDKKAFLFVLGYPWPVTLIFHFKMVASDIFYF